MRSQSFYFLLYLTALDLYVIIVLNFISILFITSAGNTISQCLFKTRIIVVQIHVNANYYVERLRSFLPVLNKIYFAKMGSALRNVVLGYQCMCENPEGITDLIKGSTGNFPSI